jgi:hypothetical protein
MIRHVLNVNIFVEEDDSGGKKYLGLDIIIPDNFDRAELIGYLAIAQRDLANSDTKIKEHLS